MSTPWRPSSALDWVAVLRNASGAHRQNPQDAEAERAVAYARTQLSPRVLRAFDAERTGQVRDVVDAQPGTGTAIASGLAQGGTFGFADEIGGAGNALLHMLPGGESPSSAYYRKRDELRAINTSADVFHPAATTGANIVGGAATGKLLFEALPAAQAALTAGGQLGASRAMRRLSIQVGAKLGAGVGGLSGYGSGEEGPVADLRPAAIGATIGGITGGTLTGAVNIRGRAIEKSVADEIASRESANRAPLLTEGAVLRNTELASRAENEQLRSAALEVNIARSTAREARAVESHAVRMNAAPEVRVRAAAATARAEAAAARAEESHAVRMENTGQVARRPIQGQMGAGQAAAEVPTMDPLETRARAGLEKMGQGGQELENSIAIMRQQGRLGPVAPVAPVVPVGEAQNPGLALHDTAGNPIPGTELPGPRAPVVPAAEARLPFLRGLDGVVMATPEDVARARSARLPDLPGGATFEQTKARLQSELDDLISPQRAMRNAGSDAARNAHNASLEALGPEGAKDAARRSAAMAREAATPAEATGMEAALQRSVDLTNILKGEPTREAMQRLQALAGQLPPGEYEALNRQVLAVPKWRAALSGR